MKMRKGTASVMRIASFSMETGEFMCLKFIISLVQKKRSEHVRGEISNFII